MLSIFSHDNSYALNFAASTSIERIDLAVAVSVPAAIFLTFCIGLIVGSFVTYCFLKTNTSRNLECSSKVPQRPIYEEITLSSGIHSEIITLEENVAYGPAGMMERVSNSSR